MTFGFFYFFELLKNICRKQNNIDIDDKKAIKISIEIEKEKKNDNNINKSYFKQNNQIIRSFYENLYYDEELWGGDLSITNEIKVEKNNYEPKQTDFSVLHSDSLSNLKKSLKKIQKENRFELSNTFLNQSQIEEKITIKAKDSCKLIYDHFVSIENLPTISPSSKNTPQINIQPQLEENKSNDNFTKEFSKHKLIIETNYSLKKETDRQFFPYISESDYQLVISIWNQKNNIDDEIIKHIHIPERITAKNLQNLYKLNWLNDEIINAYIKLINYEQKNPEIKIVNTFLYPELEKTFKGYHTGDLKKLERILKRANIDQNTTKIILIPINIHNSHWLFSKINLETKKITYYDSMMPNESFSKGILLILKKFCEAFFNNNCWELNIDWDYPQQDNCSDCGVFMLKGIHYLANGINVTFNYCDIPYFRILITLELMKGKLLK